MPDHAALYTASAPPTVPLLQSIPEVRVLGGKKTKAGIPTQYRLQVGSVVVTINVMPAREVAEHLKGFEGYVRSYHEAEPSPHTKSIIERIRKVKTVLGCVIEPGWDDDGKVQAALVALNQKQDGLIFVANSVAGPTGEALIGPLASALDDENADAPSQPEPDALDRKRRSEAILRREGVPINEHLPCIDSGRTARIRSVEEVPQRAMALAIVAVKGEGLDQATVEEFVAALGISPYLSPKERRFIDDPNPPQQDRVQFCWRYEGFWTLAWALGHVAKLARPDKTCDASTAARILLDRGPNRFLEEANLRPVGEILDQTDLVFRYHWAVVDACLKGSEPPAGLDKGVVYERHYALNWLVRHLGQDWDDVTTDT